MYKLTDILKEMTGGYIETMSPDKRFDLFEKNLSDMWQDWKKGPATRSSDIKLAKKDLLEYIEKEILK